MLEMRVILKNKEAAERTLRQYHCEVSAGWQLTREGEPTGITVASFVVVQGVSVPASPLTLQTEESLGARLLADMAQHYLNITNR